MATPVRFERAECASPRTAAVSRAKAHRTQPVSQSICWGTNTQESSGPVAGLPANVPMTFRVNKTVFCNFYLMWLVRRIQNWQDHEASASQFRERFKARSEAIADDLIAEPLVGRPSSVTEGDARRLICAPTNERFRLCVTSPPYLNSFDYSDVYRPELFIGGFVDTNKTLMKVRLKTVRSHIQANWKSPHNDEFGSLYANCISNIRERSDELWNPRIPEMIQAYFEDMEKILRGLRQRSANNGSVWLVVSTSAYGGIEVPVDLILAEIGQRVGWFLREVGVLRYLRSASQHVKHVEDKDRKSVPLRESVVIFDANLKRQKKTKKQ